MSDLATVGQQKLAKEMNEKFEGEDEEEEERPAPKPKEPKPAIVLYVVAGALRFLCFCRRSQPSMKTEGQLSQLKNHLMTQLQRKNDKRSIISATDVGN